ncbi:hypothetical protein EDB92DRAFT_1805201, partial [Lactarius akahatsu]
WDIKARFGPAHPSLPPFRDFSKMALGEAKVLLPSHRAPLYPPGDHGSLLDHAALWESTRTRSTRASLSYTSTRTLRRSRVLRAWWTRRSSADELTHVTTEHWFTWGSRADVPQGGTKRKVWKRGGPFDGGGGGGGGSAKAGVAPAFY